MKKRLAVFISPHGFGHAARACAILAALRAGEPDLGLEIFTRVPAEFFAASLGPGAFTYHALDCDVGLAQTSALEADLALTAQRLEAFLPFDRAQVAGLAQTLQTAGCALVLCDIAPLGIAVARAAGLPAVLVENFTWDLIYRGYLAAEPRLAAPSAYLAEIFALADYLIQTEPVSVPRAAHLVTPPIGRRPRLPAAAVRARLQAPAGKPLVLITMGGVPQAHLFMDRLADWPDVFFVAPGGGAAMVRRDNVVLLPHFSGFYHPDLINAADGVVGKAGYSTLAEVYQAGVPFGYVRRAHFCETESLVAYIQARLPGLEIQPDEFVSGAWLAQLPRLLALPRLASPGPNGAELAARFLREKLG